jgi:predicted extracellular nuclease
MNRCAAIRTLSAFAALGALLVGCTEPGARTAQGFGTTDPDPSVESEIEPDLAPSEDDSVGRAGDAPDGTANDPKMPEESETDPGIEVGPELPVPAEVGPPEPDVSADFDRCSAPGGDRNIYDLQDPQCPDHIDPAPKANPGVAILLKAVVVSAVFSDTFFVQEAPGGPYSGIAVYAHGSFLGNLKLGDVLDIEGSYFEYFDLSQIYLAKYTEAGGAAAPEPYLIEEPSWVATDGPLAEMFEGVLVRVEDLVTTHTQPDCPHDFGEFEVSGGLRVDDMGVAWDARLGDNFGAIVGPLQYAFGNTKLEPRNDADLVLNEKGGDTALSKCIKDECIEPTGKLGSQAVTITEVMADPYGSDTGQEWFEVHNPGPSPVSLDGWKLRDCGTQTIEIVGTGATVPAGGYVVLGANANPTTNGGVPVSYAYGADGFYLPNTVGSILLYDGQGKLVDQLRYMAFDPWTAFKLGRSLERIDPKSDGTLPESWKAATTTWGATQNQGTPGAKNAATP